MRILPLVVLVVFSNTLFSQTDLPKWNLEKCIAYALDNNIAIRQATLNQQLNKNNYTQSYLNLLPSINGFISNDLTNGQQFSIAAFRVVNQTTTTFATSLSGDLTLFSGLQQVHNILKSKSDLNAAKFDLEDAKNTVALNITTAFLQIMLNKEILKVAENQKSISLVQRENIEKRVKNGMLPEVNLLDADAQLARDEANIVSARNSVELAVLSLRLILQLKPEEKFDVEIPELNSDIASGLSENVTLSTYNTAVLLQPSIKASMARLKSAELQKKMAWGALSPSISLSYNLYDYYTNQQKQLDTTSGDFVTTPIRQQFTDQFRKGFAINMSIPIFNRWQRVSNIQNAKINVLNQSLQVEQSKNNLLQTIAQADANARAASESYFSSRKSYESAKRAYEAQEKRYNAGVSGNLEYQTAKNNLATAESEMLRNKFTYVFRKKVLDFYNGKAITIE